MQSTEPRFTKDLSNVDHTLTKELTILTSDLNNLTFEESMTKVKSIIEDETIYMSERSRQKYRNELSRIQGKSQLQFYIYNKILAGSGQSVI